MAEENTLLTRDHLAIERTKLANERTFLAYFRTFIVFLGTGVTIFKLEIFTELKSFGLALILISPVILVIGLIRLFQVRRSIRKHYG